MKTLPLLFATSAIVSMAVPFAAHAESARNAIAQALNDSAAAWTRGDITQFMALYEHSPATRYINAHGVVVGYDAIQASYAARFKPGASMGKLSIEISDVKDVGPDYAFVIGRYTLVPESGATASGITTLLFHKVDGRWLIVVDHTS